MKVLSEADMHNICDVMVESGRMYSELRKSACPLMYQYYQVREWGCILLPSSRQIPVTFAHLLLLVPCTQRVATVKSWNNKHLTGSTNPQAAAVIMVVNFADRVSWCRTRADWHHPDVAHCAKLS